MTLDCAIIFDSTVRRNLENSRRESLLYLPVFVLTMLFLPNVSSSFFYYFLSVCKLPLFIL